jgi:hypothetical protein
MSGMYRNCTAEKVFSSQFFCTVVSLNFLILYFYVQRSGFQHLLSAKLVLVLHCFLDALTSSFHGVTKLMSGMTKTRLKCITAIRSKWVCTWYWFRNLKKASIFSLEKNYLISKLSDLKHINGNEQRRSLTRLFRLFQTKTTSKLSAHY